MKPRGTCIVAVTSKGSVFFGADTLASTDYNKCSIRESKLLRMGDIVMGVAGSIRAFNIIAHSLSLPARSESETNDYRYLVSSLIPEIRQRMREAGALYTENGVEEMDANLLIGYRGKIYAVYGDFDVTPPAGDYWAIGSGTDYALGSLFSTRNIREPKKRITLALEAASEFSPSVAPPFVYERLDAGP